jgi:hypothetical protein
MKTYVSVAPNPTSAFPFAVAVCSAAADALDVFTYEL